MWHYLITALMRCRLQYEQLALSLASAFSTSRGPRLLSALEFPAQSKRSNVISFTASLFPSVFFFFLPYREEHEWTSLSQSLLSRSKPHHPSLSKVWVTRCFFTLTFIPCLQPEHSSYHSKNLSWGFRQKLDVSSPTLEFIIHTTSGGSTLWCTCGTLLHCSQFDPDVGVLCMWSFLCSPSVHVGFTFGSQVSSNLSKTRRWTGYASVAPTYKWLCACCSQWTGVSSRG